MSTKRRSLVAIVMIMVMILSQSVVFAEEVEVESADLLITGLGLRDDVSISEADWSKYELEEKVYSTNNSRGFHKIIKVKGYDLLDLIGKDNLKTDENYSVKFVSSDGFEITTTMEELTNTYFYSDFTQASKRSVGAMIVRYTKELAEFPENEFEPPIEWEDSSIDEKDLDKNFPKLAIGQANVDDMNYSKWSKDVVEIIIGDVNESVVEDTETAEEVEDKEEIEDIQDTETEKDIVFTDITEEYQFAEIAITDLVKRGIINGMGDGLYAPEGELTRAQFCKIVVDSLEYEKSEYEGGLSDVESDFWGARYIQTALDKELFAGYPDGSFKPSEKINREQMATVVARAAKIMEKPGSEKIEKFVMSKSDYLDKDDVSEWAENGVAWLEAEKVFVDITGENFYPTKVVNRAEAAVIIYNALFK